MQLSTGPRATAIGELTVSGLHTGYGRARILHDVTLHVSPGQVTALLGRNGAGKTTLLRCISGLIPAWQGTIAFDEDDITKWSPSKRVTAGIAHVPEGRRMVAGMTVRQNLLLGGYLLPRRALTERLEEIVSMFPTVRTWLERDATSLSGGQQQLAAIARALMAGPSVLLLDEPLTGLAPTTAGSVMDSIHALGETGLTILLVEQNVHMTLDVADTVHVLDLGSIAQLGGTSSEHLAERIESMYMGVDLMSSTTP